MTNALGAAALGLLIVDPRQLFTASFQMAFLCVLIVSGIGIPMLERTSQQYRRALTNWDSQNFAIHLPARVAQFRLDLQMISTRLGQFIADRWAGKTVRSTTRLCFATWDLLLISAVMQAGLALPMAYYFHRATTIGLPANLTVVPLTELMMPAAVAAVGLGYVSPWLAKLPVLLTSLALDGITGTIHGLGGLRLADLRVAMPSAAMMAIAIASLVAALWSARRRFAITIFGLVTLFVVALAVTFVAPRQLLRPGVVEMTAIDVGQGDSTLVVTPDGKSLLVDAGAPIGPSGSQLDFGEDVVSPYLWNRGFSRLDAVAISHGHSDHLGGMAAVLRNFRPKELWIGLIPPSPALQNLISIAQSYGVKVVRHWEGDAFELGAIHVRVLFPRVTGLWGTSLRTAIPWYSVSAMVSRPCCSKETPKNAQSAASVPSSTRKQASLRSDIMGAPMRQLRSWSIPRAQSSRLSRLGPEIRLDYRDTKLWSGWLPREPACTAQTWMGR